MKTQQLYLLFLLVLCSCSITGENGPEESVEILPEISVSQLQKLAVNFDNKATRITEYQGSNLISIHDKYYNASGKDLFDVYLNNPSSDTSSLVLYTYENNRLLKKEVFPFDGEKYVFGDVFTFRYDSSDKLIQQKRGNTIYFNYEYNEQDQMEKIIFGPQISFQEGYQFFYDDQNRIQRQIWMVFTQPESPIRDWHYIYDEGEKLIYKSIPTAPDGELTPMFEYSYDAQGRLIKELERYPEFGFQEHFSTIYQYQE
ncbi:MAG: hypothetical protein ACQEW9_07360 [Bacteroidota bacterium]